MKIEMLKQIGKQAISTMDEYDNCSLQIILNIINNVFTKRKFKNKISPEQIELLKPYRETFEKLIDEKVPQCTKLKLLRENGRKYIPTFLDVFEQGTRRDCPICDAVKLKRLSQHLTVKHGIRGSEKTAILKKQNEASEKHKDEKTHKDEEFYKDEINFLNKNYETDDEDEEF